MSWFSLLPPSFHPNPCSHSQFPHCCPCPWVIYTFIHVPCLVPSPSFHHYPPTPRPSGHIQSVPCFHACGSILFISLFCSLDSSYRWDRMVFVFHWLALLLSMIFSSSIHAIAKLLLTTELYFFVFVFFFPSFLLSFLFLTCEEKLYAFLFLTGFYVWGLMRPKVKVLHSSYLPLVLGFTELKVSLSGFPLGTLLH